MAGRTQKDDLLGAAIGGALGGAILGSGLSGVAIGALAAVFIVAVIKSSAKTKTPGVND